jgi:hypothetical protein
MAYRLYACSTHEAVDTVEMHVLAKAYRAAWRSMCASDPIGPHLLHALDLVIDFGMPRADVRAASGIGRQPGMQPLADPPRAQPGARVRAAAALARRAQGARDAAAAPLDGGFDAAERAEDPAGAVSPAVLDVLLEIGGDEPLLVAACLCGAPDAAGLPRGEIESMFGSQVANLVGELRADPSAAGVGSAHGHAASELERLAVASPAVQTLRLARDLADLREPHWLRNAVRDGRLAEVAARARTLVRAHPLLLRRVRAALALWETIPRALTPHSPAD